MLMTLFLLGFLIFPKFSFAIEDSLSVPNNKIGVHILFTSEITAAADLINSAMGDWGYVTIPIQAGDKDLEKWQKFMDDARDHHVIPIIRLATEGDYFNTSVWRKPTRDDILDFANFLNSLNWPVKNRYIVIFNEVNRGDEWEGAPNPEEYAVILSYAVNVFKSVSEDFFIISSGMDNASANIPGKSINEYNFMTGMNNAIPGIFSQIDGLGSHSYPNPAFSQPPSNTSNMSISSFKYEKNLAYELSGKNLPVFITETGWSNEKLSHNQIASYFRYAFESVWSDKDIIAVTPFLLSAAQGPFFQFSLMQENGSYNEVSKSIQNIKKIKGEPKLNSFSESVILPKQFKNIPLKSFPQKIQYALPSDDRTKSVIEFLKWLFKLSG